MLTEEHVAVISISSPADAPVAVISIPPALDVITIESAAFCDDAILTWPVVSKSKPLVPASTSIPPATPLAFSLIACASDSVDVMFTEDPVAAISISSPADAPVAVISIPPALDVITIESAAFCDDAILTWPVVSKSKPLVPASTSIPPAALLAFSLIACASASVDVMLTEEPVAVISISSPADAPVAVISIPPTLEVITIESAAFCDDAILTWPVVSKSKPAVPASTSIPPAALLAFSLIACASASVDVMLTEEPVAVISISSPADAPVAVISIPPTLEVITIESAAFCDDAILTWPVVSKSKPAVPASTSIPPAALLAFSLIACASASVDVMLTEEPVAVISISSPADAPVAVISIPPTLEVITIESAAFCDDAILTWPVVSKSKPAVPASTSIPPAALLAFSLIACASASVDVMLTEEPVAVISISSPAVAPVAVISIPPTLEVITIESAAFCDDAILTWPVVSKSKPAVPASTSIPPAALLAFSLIACASASVDVMLTEEPVAVISISSPADAPVAVISIPPTLEVITIESAAFCDDAILTWPVVSKSKPAVPASTSIPPTLEVITIESAAFCDDAILTWPVVSTSTPPVPASISTVVAPVALPIVIVRATAPVPMRTSVVLVPVAIPIG